MHFHAYVYGPRRGPLSLSMEELAARWVTLPGFFFEWDGSFTWTNASERWTMEGNVYDDGNQIQYVDLHAIDQAGSLPIDPKRQKDAFPGRLHQFFDTLSDQRGELVLMRLPEMAWQNLQDFEREVVAR